MKAVEMYLNLVSALADCTAQWDRSSHSQITNSPDKFLSRMTEDFERAASERIAANSDGVSPPQMSASEFRQRIGDSRSMWEAEHRYNHRYNRAYRTLFRWFENAHGLMPGLPLVAADRLGRDEYWRGLMKPLPSLSEAQYRRGEGRSRALLTCLQDACSSHYDTYVRSLCEVFQLARGKVERASQKFGAVVRRSEVLLEEFPYLIVPNVALLRNARAHGHFQYDPKKKSTLVWDERRAPMEVSNDELKRIIVQILRLSNDFRAAYSSYFYRTLIPASLWHRYVDSLAVAMEASDDHAFALANEEFASEVTKILSPLSAVTSHGAYCVPSEGGG